MKYLGLFIMSVFVFLTSCKQNTKESGVAQVLVEKTKYYNPKDETIAFDSIKKVKISYKDSIITWKGYHKVKEKLAKYRSTSPNEILSSSEELLADVKLMRDSITIVALKDKGIRARINALYNQSLRLREMKEIPAITVPEVVKQTQGMYVIFRMINSKINAIYDQINFEKELIEDDFMFSKIDSIQ